jgi:hypothetical protein
MPLLDPDRSFWSVRLRGNQMGNLSFATRVRTLRNVPLGA